MTVSSTRFLINYQTATMPRPEFVPGWLHRDFDPALLQAWLIATMAMLMTAEWVADGLRARVDNFILVASVLGIVLWLGLQNAIQPPVFCRR